ncbi:GNAT family N-acetyltransferase [Solidesulfovibrio magneticus]|nr:GNAT family N-acetyltransferase [Solidesulfovibrio magneticus]
MERIRHGMPVIIVPGHPEDYPALAALWEASVRASHHFVAEADIHFFKPLVRDVYLGAVTLTCAFDGVGDGRALGFSGVAEGKIEMLFVAPEAFGRGIGTKLLRHAVETLGAREVDVNEQNARTVAFYLRRGFVVVGRSELDGTGRPYPLLHMRLA